MLMPNLATEEELSLTAVHRVNGADWLHIKPMPVTLFTLTIEDIHSSAVIDALFSNFRIRRPAFHGLRLLGEMGLANVAPGCVGVSASCSLSYSGDYASVVSQRNQGEWSAGCKICTSWSTPFKWVGCGKLVWWANVGGHIHYPLA